MYSFGQTVSLPFYTDTWTPESWYDRLEENLRVRMHTLVLLDIKVREQSEENMARWASIATECGLKLTVEVEGGWCISLRGS